MEQLTTITLAMLGLGAPMLVGVHLAVLLRGPSRTALERLRADRLPYLALASFAMAAVAFYVRFGLAGVMLLFLFLSVSTFAFWFEGRNRR